MATALVFVPLVMIMYSARTHRGRCGGLMVSVLNSRLSIVVRVLVLAWDNIVLLCSWARHLTLTGPLSTQVYKWVPAYLMLGGNPAMDWHPIQGE